MLLDRFSPEITHKTSDVVVISEPRKVFFLSSLQFSFLMTRLYYRNRQMQAWINAHIHIINKIILNGAVLVPRTTHISVMVLFTIFWTQSRIHVVVFFRTVYEFIFSRADPEHVSGTVERDFQYFHIFSEQVWQLFPPSVGRFWFNYIHLFIIFVCFSIAWTENSRFGAWALGLGCAYITQTFLGEREMIFQSVSKDKCTTGEGNISVAACSWNDFVNARSQTLCYILVY